MNQKRITNQILNQKNFTLNSTLNYLFNISNMKKLFSYLLISSMVVLSSCTNYDDQFDDLNAQINSLKSQIEGFSSLSSGLTSLQGTVASLQTAIANIPVTPATDISGLESGLADLQDLVESLQAQLADAATAESVSELASALELAQADLKELLDSNNIYAPTGGTSGGTLVVSTQPELDFALALGESVSIVNGGVDITHTTSMSDSDVATLMARFVSVTGTVTYTATASTTVAGEFTNLNGALNVYIDQTGDVNLPALATTGNLTIDGDVLTDSVSLDALTKVTGLSFANLTKATSFSMSALAEYDGNITITISDEGSIDLSSFKNDTVASTGAAATSFDELNVTAASLTAPLYVAGKITANEVLNVSLPVWKGTNTSSFPDATTVVLPSITAAATGNDYVLATMFPDASSIHIIGNTYTSTGTGAATYEIEIDAEGQGKVETLILSGVFSTVNLKDNTDLVSLDFDATAEDFILDNTDLVTASVDLTLALATSTGKTSVEIKNNDALSAITVNNANALNKLVITDNRNLKSFSFPDLSTSAGTAAIATIKDNELDGTITYTNAAKTAGSLASTSGVVELGDFLDDVITKRTASVRMQVILDDATEVSSTGVSTDTTDYAIVDLQSAVSTTVGAIGAKKERRAWALDTNGSDKVNIQIGSDFVFVNSSGAREDITPSANMALAVAELASTSAVERAKALGYDLTAQVGANVQSLTISFTATNDSATVESNIASPKTVSATAMTVNQYATLTIGSGDVAATVTATSTDPVGGIATALVAAYNAKYPAASRHYTLTDTASKVVISVAEGSGNRYHNAAVSITTTTASAVAGVPDAILGYVIGDSKATTDNKLEGDDVIILLQNRADLDTFDDVTVAISSTTGIASTTLASTLDYATDTTADGYAGNAWPTEARGIVEPYFEGTGGTTTTTGANYTTDRTAFL